jgi:hypothetical protein
LTELGPVVLYQSYTVSIQLYNEAEAGTATARGGRKKKTTGSGAWRCFLSALFFFGVSQQAARRVDQRQLFIIVQKHHKDKDKETKDWLKTKPCRRPLYKANEEKNRH